MLRSLISNRKSKHPTFILASYGAECYSHSFLILKTNTQHLFSVIRSRMLPSFISDAKDKTPNIYFSVIQSRMLPSFISNAKDKHPAFVSASYGDKWYRHSFPMLVTKHPTFLASYRVKCYRHSFRR